MEVNNFTTASNDTSSADPYKSFLTTEALLVINSIIFLLGTIGNVLVCGVVYRRYKRGKLKTYYIFILNMAVADLAVTWLCIPFDIPLILSSYATWPYPAGACEVLIPLQGITVSASALTLTTVSITRYQAIVHPLKREITNKQSVGVCLFIWVLSFLASLPYIYSLEFDDKVCVELWKQEHRKAYTLFLFMWQFILPFAIMSYAYGKISIKLFNRMAEASRSKKAQLKETHKVIRMLVSVTVLFALCTLPNHCVWVWADFGQIQPDQYGVFIEMVAIFNVFILANSAVNPICYSLCYEKIRREFKQILCRCVKKELHWVPSSSDNNTKMTRTSQYSPESSRHGTRSSNWFNSGSPKVGSTSYKLQEMS